MDNQESNNPFISIHLPVALVALALSLLFLSQIKGYGNAMETMKWQSDNVDKQIDNYKKAKEQLAKTIEERKPSVATSSDQQTRFAVLIKKVNELSKGDDGDADAKVIINILVNSGITSIQVPDAAPEAKKDK